MMLLQETSITKLIRITKTISTVIVEAKEIMAIFKEVNFRTLMKATVMHKATTSLTIQLLLENHQPKHTPNPTNKLIPSITLTSFPFTLNPTLSTSSLRRKMSSLKHSPTPKIPKNHESTSTATLTAYRLKAAITPPMIKITLKLTIHGMVIVMPLPPMDQALEQMATMEIRKATKMISMSNPHSKVFLMKSLSQMTLQVRGVRPCTWILTLSKQLKQSTGLGQLFLIPTVHQVPGQQELAFREGEKIEQVVVVYIVVTSVRLYNLMQYQVLVLSYVEFCQQVYRTLREQLKKDVIQMNESLQGEEAVESYITVVWLVVTRATCCWENAAYMRNKMIFMLDINLQGS